MKMIYTFKEVISHVCRVKFATDKDQQLLKTRILLGILILALKKIFLKLHFLFICFPYCFLCLFSAQNLQTLQNYVDGLEDRRGEGDNLPEIFVNRKDTHLLFLISSSYSA